MSSSYKLVQFAWPSRFGKTPPRHPDLLDGMVGFAHEAVDMNTVGLDSKYSGRCPLNFAQHRLPKTLHTNMDTAISAGYRLYGVKLVTPARHEILAS